MTNDKLQTNFKYQFSNLSSLTENQHV